MYKLKSKVLVCKLAQCISSGVFSFRSSSRVGAFREFIWHASDGSIVVWCVHCWVLLDREFTHSRKCLEVPIREKLDSRNIWRILDCKLAQCFVFFSFPPLPSVFEFIWMEWWKYCCLVLNCWVQGCGCELVHNKEKPEQSCTSKSSLFQFYFSVRVLFAWSCIQSQVIICMLYLHCAWMCVCVYIQYVWFYVHVLWMRLFVYKSMYACVCVCLVHSSFGVHNVVKPCHLPNSNCNYFNPLRLAWSILGLGSMGYACYNKIKPSSMG